MTVVAAEQTRDRGALGVEVVELTGDLADLRLDPELAGARLHLRLHGIPVGYTTSYARRGVVDVLSAIRSSLAGATGRGIFAALARTALESPVLSSRDLVADLWSRAPAMPHPARVTLTIAICTRGRPDGVARTLASLEAEKCEGMDVVVIDNAPTDDRTRQIVARMPWVRYDVEPTPGLDRARNRALHFATGDVVAFADDDVIVDSGWCAAVRCVFDDNPDLTLMTGLVEPDAMNTQAQRWFEAYGGFGRGYVPRWIHAPGASSRAIAFPLANTGQFGTGANLAIRRNHALRLGGFDSALDVGTPTKGGGDLEMMFRVLKANGLLCYAPSASVRHTHRLTWDELASQIESWGSGMAAHLTRTARAHPEERLSVAALRAWLYASWFARRLATSYVRTPFPRTLIVREIRGSFAGSRLYSHASRQEPPPPRTPALNQDGAAGRQATADVKLGSPLAPLAAAGASRIQISVHREREMLGSLTLPIVGGVVGATRLRDTIAARWGREILGQDASSVLRRVGEFLTRGAHA